MTGSVAVRAARGVWRSGVASMSWDVLSVVICSASAGIAAPCSAGFASAAFSRSRHSVSFVAYPSWANAVSLRAW